MLGAIGGNAGQGYKVARPAVEEAIYSAAIKLRSARPRRACQPAHDAALAAEAVAQAVSEKNTDDLINIVAVGSNESLVKLLQSDVIAGIVVEDPFRMGYDGVKTALAASKGEPVPANVDTGTILVTKANLGSARVQELLNPEIK
jgi:hypothetical protein